jgi:alkaline phosphatase
MPRRKWGRIAVQCLLSIVVFVGLGALLLWATGRSIDLQRSGGDQSQSSPIDASPAPPVSPLPVVDWPEVRNVVLILGDGMGFSQIAMARSELKRLNDRLFIERFPVTGWHTTHSLNAAYTDSAASASSLATGRKVEYLAISATVDGKPHRTVLEAARDRGMAVGAVTDSYLWDATPSAFLSHSPTRRNMPELASQMARSGARVLIGGEHENVQFDGRVEGRKGPPLRGRFVNNRFRIVRTAEAFSALDPGADEPVLGLFPTDSIADPETPPHLPELAAFALDKLSRDPDGFFLVVESEEPDSGGHYEDLQRIVRGIEALNQIAAAAVDFAMRDQATLVLVTADHETGGMAILHGDEDHNLGVRWATSSHSGEPVPIFAFGAGATRFGGVKDNTDIARILSDLLELGLFD